MRTREAGVIVEPTLSLLHGRLGIWLVVFMHIIIG